MSAPLVFLDTETTGLSLSDDIWEFAAVRREPDGTETEWHLFIEHDENLCAGLPSSFRDDHFDRYLSHRAYTKKQAAEYIAAIFRNGDPHVVGAVPNFDTERISRLVLSQFPSWVLGWHYHLIDVENLAVGYLAGRLAESREVYGGENFEPHPGYVETIAPPWNSDSLSRAVGVDPDQFARHTAMGDVRWAMAIYDAVMNPAVSS